jgi:flagellar M-ring protein FliF
MFQLAQLSSSVGRLPRGKLIAFLVLAITIGGLLYASFAVLNKTVLETLYSNLDAEDVNRIGSALSEVGINFDVNEAGTAVLVEHGKTAQARMILASKGLPKSDKSGYELFDQMGSLGLTSFMQQVTRVRALEGELVRTIQQLEGIKSARVHLALKSEGAFRNRDEKPSASVVVRSSGTPDEKTAGAIRQIVSAAIPGLTSDQVFVSTTDGRVLSAAGQAMDSEPSSMLAMEEEVAREAQDRIVQTLAAVTGINNIRVSVAAKLDLAKRLIKEKNFEPDSKVERSTRTVKSLDQSSNDGQNRQVSADQNIPREVGTTDTTGTSLNKKESKEELVNYEVASTESETISNGYKVERLSIAVVVNKQAFTPSGGTPPDESQLQLKKAEIEELVRSAAGADSVRNDTIKVSLLDFVAEEEFAGAVEDHGIKDVFLGNLGTIINALALLMSIVLVIMLGLRPALSQLAGLTRSAPEFGEEQPVAIGSGPVMSALPQSLEIQSGLEEPHNGAVPIDKLNRMVGIDVDRAAQVLKRWLEQPLKDVA